MAFQDSSFLIVSKTSIDRFQSRGQQLCKLLGIIESFNMQISSNPTGFFLYTNMRHAVTSGENDQWRTLDSRTRTTTESRFHLNFFRVFSENKQPGKLHYRTFSLEKQKRLLF